jgi:PAS domain S-box-containing protein
VDIWGYTSEEIFADPSLLIQMHNPEDLGNFLKANKNSRETGEPLYHRYTITARDGQTRWLDHHGGPSRENGRVLVKAIVLDATREVEAQLQVEKEREISRTAQKVESIGQLTGGVAHDFNNLLAVILGNLELLRDFDEPGLEKELIDAAVTATLKGADLTRNMLAFARKAPLMPVTLDLNKVVRETKNWIGRTLPDSVSVETSLLAGLWPVEADRASLESALLNLTLNAIDAMEGRGNLTIETANVRIDQPYIDSRQEELAPGRYIMLAVSDTGPGIPSEALGSIFEPFFTTKPIGKGSGLGLSMTFGFMRQSGGTIQVYTEIGQGTTFKLYFPASTVQPDEPTTPLVGKYGVASKAGKLLLAEDETAVRETLEMILERAGYQVMATATGDEAFAAFEADPTFDLLLTDIVMPGKLQGTDLAKALRDRWPALPVIFMSGYAREATVHGNGLRPEDIRMMKPVQRVDLLTAIEQVLSQV